MVLRLIEGFERQSGVVNGATEYSASAGGGAVSYPAGRTGGNALQLSLDSSFAPFVDFTLPVTANTFVGGCAMYVAAATAFPTSGLPMKLIESSTVHLQYGFDASGHAQVMNSANSVLATGSSVFTSVAAWNYVEIEAYIHDTAGYVKMWVNGSLEINITSQDTKNGGTGLLTKWQWLPRQVYTTQVYLDDIYFGDTTGSAPYNTALGDVVVERLLPSGNGASSQWVNSAGNSTNNYTYVDDLSQTDYVGSPTSGNKDTYAMQDVNTAVSTVHAYQLEVLAAKSDAGNPAADLQVVGRDGSGNEQAETVRTAATVTTTADWRAGSIRTVLPDGTTALTPTNVNAMQIGVKLT